ncbi:MAG: glycosyltransferase family 4 protein, partial [Opitutaceae bacterium]|nr:glycosyltransferase family 4 protein [Opitutaceae bacterium]
GAGPDLVSRVRRKLLPRLERLWVRAAQWFHPRALVHFPWGDACVDIHPPGRRRIATLHQPHENWRPATVAWCRRLGGVHTLTERDAAHLRRAIPGLPVRCILHGIDVRFWQPAARPPGGERKRIVFTGYYLRNVPMFFRVVRRVLDERPDVEVELLLNPDVKLPPEFLPLPPRTRLVGPYSVEELRAFLQSAWLMFMPYDNVTASNSVCEALACGLPLITTRVGGMESYALGGMVLVENNDDVAAHAAILRCLDDSAWRAELSARARAAAVAHLDWDHVAAQLDTFYAEIAAAPR